MSRYVVQLVPGSMSRSVNGRNGSHRDGHYYHVIDREAHPNDDIVAECPTYVKAMAVVDALNHALGATPPVPGETLGAVLGAARP